MARLIDADALGKVLFFEDVGTPDERWKSTSEFKQYVEAMPTIDAVPVVHGKWIEKTETCGWSDVEYAECSACGEDFALGGYGMDEIKQAFKFCPNCGAKMTGEKGGNNVHQRYV